MFLFIFSNFPGHTIHNILLHFMRMKLILFYIIDLHLMIFNEMLELCKQSIVLTYPIDFL